MVRETVDEMIKNIADEEDKRCAYVHLYGVGLMAALIALRRGYDRRTAELAEIAGILHDLGTYVDPAMNTPEHAHACAGFAVENVLDRLSCFTDEEKELVRRGIYNHSDKHVVGSDFDEIIKDADAAQHALRNPAEDYYYNSDRMRRLLGEMIRS